MADYTYIDSNGDKWICDTIESDGNGGYNHVQRIGYIASYNGEYVGSTFMSTTGELSTGASVIYVLSTPVVTPISNTGLDSVIINTGTNTAYASDAPEIELSFIAWSEQGGTPAEQYEAYLSQLETDFTKIAKLEFLNPGGGVAFALDNNALNKRSGAFLQEGSITCNWNNGRRRQASVTLANLDNEYEYNISHVWFGQEIRLSEGLILPDGTEYYIPQGVFLIENPQEALKPGQKTVTYALADKWANLDGSLFGNLEDVYSVSAGTNVFTAIASLLTLDKFTMESSGDAPIDPTPPLFTNYYNNKTQMLTDGTVVALKNAPYDFTSSSTGTLADVVIGLNDMIAGDIGYNQSGRLVINPSQDDITDTDKPVLWEFTQGEKSFLGADFSPQPTKVYNDVIVVGATSDTNAIARGRSQNFDPTSDTCISRIGRKTIRIEMPNYYSDQMCQDYAEWQLKRYSVMSKEITVSSTQMFHIIENQLITVQRNDKPGAPVERHLIRGFTRPIGQTGAMTINCVSVNDFPIASPEIIPPIEDFRQTAIAYPLEDVSVTGAKQGGCTDGTYIYQTAGDASAYTYMQVIKYKISDGSYTTVRYNGTPNFGHANDMTYNPNNGYLYIATMRSEAPIIVLDARDLSYVETIDVKNALGVSYGPFQICFDRKTNHFLSTYQNNMLVYDEEWNYLSTITMPVRPNGTAQGCETDGYYIYKVYYDPNEIDAIAMDGTYAATIGLPVTNEPETLMYGWNGKYYISVNTTGTIFYQIQLE